MKEFFFVLFYDFLFFIVPSERGLLLLLWHSRQYYKLSQPPKPVYWVLDDMLFSMELRLARRGLSKDRLLLYQRLNYAVQDAMLLEAIVGFLESDLFDRDVLNKLAGELRVVTRFGSLLAQKKQEEEKDIDTDRLGEGEDSVEKGVVVARRVIHAKTYFIAAHLHFELTGDEPEYLRLSVQPKELADFVRRQFGAGELPGTFYDLKGYSYKHVLNGKRAGPRGQLKPCFGQIAKNPDVFGKDVAEKAQSILLQYFE